MSIISSEAKWAVLQRVVRLSPEEIRGTTKGKEYEAGFIAGATRRPTNEEIVAGAKAFYEALKPDSYPQCRILRRHATRSQGNARKGIGRMNNLIHCDMCGDLMTKRWGETIDGKTYCRDCVPKKRLIDLGEPTEFDGTDEIVCPYCGHRYEDSYECGGNDEYFEEECEDCGREFYVTRIIDISYDTKPKEATEE